MERPINRASIILHEVVERTEGSGKSYRKAHEISILKAKQLPPVDTRYDQNLGSAHRIK